MHSDRYLTLALALAATVFPAVALERETSFDRTLTVTGPVELDVTTHSGRITVRAAEGREVRIHGIIRLNRDFGSGDAESRMREIQQNPPIRQLGNTVRIDTIEGEATRRGLSISYEITAPPNARLRSRTGSGALVVEDIAGPANISTGSGSVTVTRVNGEVRAHTGSGRVELVAIKGGVDAHTGSGGIDGAGLAGSIVLRTGSGSIRLEQTAQASVKAHTGSGGITLRLPRQGGFDLRAHTGSGGIHADQSVIVKGSISKHNLNATLRGGGPLIDLSTGSGAIRIE